MKKNFLLWQIISSCVLILLFLSFIGCQKEGLEQESILPSDRVYNPVIFGTVYDASEGRYVSEASVTITPGYSNFQTDSTGSFLLDSLPSGKYTLTAKKDTMLTSIEISTLSTDFLSVEMTFGTTSKNTMDIAYREGTSWITKKIYNENPPEYLPLLFEKLTLAFDEIREIDFHPLTENTILFSGKMTGQYFKIWTANLLTGTASALASDANTDCTDPTYSPNGKKFAFVKNKKIYIADISAPLQEPSLLIRDKGIRMEDNKGNAILNLDIRNEEMGYPYSDTLPVIPGFTGTDGPIASFMIGGNHPVHVAAINWLYQLHAYFNDFCYQAKQANNTVDVQTCIAQSTGNCFNTPAIAAPESCRLVYAQDPYDPSPSPNPEVGESLFDALNLPAECPVEMKSPDWSPRGNQIVFLARATGCTTTRPKVCKKFCDDSAWEVFVAPVEVELYPAFRVTENNVSKIYTFDRFLVNQITHDDFEDLNPFFAPKSDTVLYDKKKYSSSAGYYIYYLISSNTSPLGDQTRVLLSEDYMPHYADISPDGKKILWVSTQYSENNTSQIPQIWLGEWSGLISKDTQITRYSNPFQLTFPQFYKITPDDF